jgi:hypothetical protein
LICEKAVAALKFNLRANGTFGGGVMKKSDVPIKAKLNVPEFAPCFVAVTTGPRYAEIISGLVSGGFQRGLSL